MKMTWPIFVRTFRTNPMVRQALGYLVLGMIAVVVSIVAFTQLLHVAPEWAIAMSLANAAISAVSRWFDTNVAPIVKDRR